MPPYTLLLQENEDTATGTTLRKIYDVKTGDYQLLLQGFENSGSLNFFGQSHQVTDLDRRVELSFADGVSLTGERTESIGGRITYRFAGAGPQLMLPKPLQKTGLKLNGQTLDRKKSLPMPQSSVCLGLMKAI